ncbi:MAG: FAD binding domain-containing protein [Candidatus Binataceae bacterium]
MYSSAFEYHRVASVKEALALLGQFGDDARLLSGGHSLLPMLKLRLAQPGHLIDIGGIAGMSKIREENGKIAVGAMATHHQIEESKLVREKLGLLGRTASAIGDIQVRNRGTIGGSLSHADPAADYPAAVLALEGEIRLESASGARIVKAEEFFVDLMTTAAEHGEVLTEVFFAPLPAGAGYAYLKHPQPASGFAVVGAAALVQLDKSGKCERIRIGVTGLGPKAFRAKAVEAALQGKALDAGVIDSAARQAASGIEALSDIHASSEFRAQLAQVYTRRAVAQAAATARR